MNAFPEKRKKGTRSRRIPGAEETIATDPHVIQKPETKRGSWHQVFGNLYPLEIEVGMGKGRFIMELAGAHPGINYIGIERYSSIFLRGLGKRSQLDLNNIYFMCVGAKTTPELFAPGEVSRIYLNFPGPWPKDRHTKRRLTSPGFMAMCDKILAHGGVMRFKTDSRESFEYSLKSILSAGWKILSHTFDLHNSPMAGGNIMTEYETKFATEGKPICKLVAARAQAGLNADTYTK